MLILAPGLAPKPIAHHLVISGQNSLPTPDPSSPEMSTAAMSAKTRRFRHPKHLLKHRFLPYGALVGAGTPSVAAMDVDNIAIHGKEEGIIEAEKRDISLEESVPKGRGKGKKRKTEVETPKKNKKLKI